MAVTKREQEIIDLDEAGLSVPEIAAKLRISIGYVKGIVSALCRDNGSDRGFSRMIARGSQQLLVAIQRARAA